MKLQLDCPSHPNADVHAGLLAAMAVFNEAKLHPVQAADGHFKRERDIVTAPFRVMATDEKDANGAPVQELADDPENPLTDADLAAAEVWDRAYEAAMSTLFGKERKAWPQDVQFGLVD